MNIFTNYVACSICGYKKLCKLENRKYICRACDKSKEKTPCQTKTR